MSDKVKPWHQRKPKDRKRGAPEKRNPRTHDLEAQRRLQYEEFWSDPCWSEPLQPHS